MRAPSFIRYCASRIAQCALCIATASVLPLATAAVGAPPPGEGARVREAASARIAAMPSATNTVFALASPFSNHMVLQRDCTVPVWGVGAPGAGVNISLLAENGEERQTVAKASATVGTNGRWIVFLPPQPAGGPYAFEAVCGDDARLTLTDVLIGDVWLCAGQSNMEMDVKWTLPKAQTALSLQAFRHIRRRNLHTLQARWKSLARMPLK